MSGLSPLASNIIGKTSIAITEVNISNYLKFLSGSQFVTVHDTVKQYGQFAHSQFLPSAVVQLGRDQQSIVPIPFHYRLAPP